MRRSGNLFFLVGVLLVLGSFGLLAFTQLRAHRAADSASELAQQLESLLPPLTPGIMDPSSDLEMSALELAGEDFIGVVHIPAFQRTLPLGSSWDAQKVAEYPHRFWGSACNGSLILGGSDQLGQFDFLDQIQIGDAVLVNDMTGTQFSYMVDDIRRTTSAQADILLDGESHLTLFARQARSLEYVIVRCVMG